MKTSVIIRIASIILFLFIGMDAIAQKGRKGRHHPHRHHHPHKVVIKRSPYRPAKVVVYNPVWRPTYAYNRRWVFWPKYNLYWDNWRGHYMFWNGTIWISQPAAPPVVVNVNLAEEKHKELKEDEDDTDDIYKNNSSHKEEENKKE